MASSYKGTKIILTDIQTIRKEVLETVFESDKKLTPGDLEKRLSQKYIINKKALKAAIRNLVADRELIYTYIFGCSFLGGSCLTRV